MFGFVTFVHSETVRTILARGNPHFICDSRVLVKPYKEKGRILEKYVESFLTFFSFVFSFLIIPFLSNNSRRQQQQLLQQMERGNFSPGSSPSGLDLFDCHLG